MRRPSTAASSIFLIASVLLSSPASAEGPAQLVSVDPLTLPAPTLLEPMSFALDPRTPAEKIQPMLWEEALKRGPDELIPIIITLHEPLLAEPLRGATAEADAHRVQWVASLAHEFASAARLGGMTDLRAISHFPIVFGQARPADLARIAVLPNVGAVELDGAVRELRTQGAALMNADDLRTVYGGNGNGVGVAVVDSGVEDIHAELDGGVVIAQGDYTATTGDGTIDGTGHGTAVAGIIAGQSGGMARQATIWALKVLDNSGSGNFSMVEAALNSAYANRNSFGGLDLINMSIGESPGTPYNADCDSGFPSMTTIVNTLFAAGIPSMVSSGNNGFLNGVLFPACLSNVISVGAVTDAAFNPDPLCGGAWPADAITCYSNSGVPLDILAPSHCASTTGLAGGSVSCFNGTSAAAPYASGVAAQIISLLAATTPSQLRNAFMTTGRPITDINGITRNRIDAVQAYQALAGSGGGPCVGGPTTACVLGNRFKVEIEWTDFGGVTRDAFVASAGTADTALFYWTDPNNWEFLIKAINACVPPYNPPFDHFWVYFAAATNVGYRVTVTDTVAGGPPRVYTNPVGTLAPAVNDILAFPCL